MTNLAAFFMQQAEASPHIQFVYDVAAGRVLFINAAYHTVLGGGVLTAGAELPALLARLHPDDRAYLLRYWKLWVQGRMADEVEFRLQGQDVLDQWFCLTPFWQHPAGGALLLGGSLRDISEAKHHQANSDHYNARKNTALEILAHDLSGAFVMVQQITAVLADEVAPAGGAATEMLAVLAATSQSSVQMIRDFVAVEFLSAANTDLVRRRVEVAGALRPILDELRRSRTLLGQSFTFTLPTEPVYALLDVNKFAQVLTNLLSNALKFTPDDGQVVVRLVARPDTFRLEVADTGIGIPVALQGQLFDSFTPARRPGLRAEPSTGLGMALCKTIVEWHEGTISVVSAEGAGTTVVVEVPRAEAPAA